VAAASVAASTVGMFPTTFFQTRIVLAMILGGHHPMSVLPGAVPGHQGRRGRRPTAMRQRWPQRPRTVVERSVEGVRS